MFDPFRSETTGNRGNLSTCHWQLSSRIISNQSKGKNKGILRANYNTPGECRQTHQKTDGKK